MWLVFVRLCCMGLQMHLAMQDCVLVLHWPAVACGPGGAHGNAWQ